MSDAPTSDAPTGARTLTVVVVAHPDDEILWLSSALPSAGRVVFCFGDSFGRPKKSKARRQAVWALPLAGLVNLKMPESGARFSVDWNCPRQTSSGIEVTDEVARVRYEANYLKLVEMLRMTLEGCRDVFTHNPWGEYGHAEHIQIYRAIAALQAELGYTIWFSNYVGSRSWLLAREIGRRPCWTHRRTSAPDLATARRLMRVYKRHGAWTWARFHRWPAHETFYAQPPAQSPEIRHPLSGEWLLDVGRLGWWPPPWRTARRRLE